MFKNLFVCIISTITMNVWSAPVWSDSGGSASDCRLGVAEKIQVIKSTADTDRRVDYALEFAKFIHAHTTCTFDRMAIADIETLLEDDVDGVRMAGAMALGDIGPPARSTIHALKKVIRRSDAIFDADPSPLLPVNSSGDAARNALYKIAGIKVHPYQ